jgi:hypothetical protein
MELGRLMSVEVSSAVSGRRYRPKGLTPIAEKEPRRVTCEASCCRALSPYLKRVQDVWDTILRQCVSAATDVWQNRR